MSSFRDWCNLCQRSVCFHGFLGYFFLLKFSAFCIIEFQDPGSEDGLRLRWDAVRGFFVENLFECLSCFSEFRNPDLAVVILVDVLGCGRVDSIVYTQGALSCIFFCMFCAGINVHQLKMLCSTTMLGFNDPC